MMAEYVAGEVEVHLEPQIKTTPVAELEGQEEEQNLAQKGRKQKELNKVELSKLKSLKTIKCSFQMKTTPYGRRILSTKGL